MRNNKSRAEAITTAGCLLIVLLLLSVLPGEKSATVSEITTTEAHIERDTGAEMTTSGFSVVQGENVRLAKKTDYFAATARATETETETERRTEKQTEKRTEPRTEKRTEDPATKAAEPETEPETQTTESDIVGTWGNWDLHYSEPYNVTRNRLTRENGVVYFEGHRETWYSTKEPGQTVTAWEIPGKHVAEDGTIRDADGYVCIASSDHRKHTVILTSVGVGKVYDTGCSHGTMDIYTTW